MRTGSIRGAAGIVLLILTSAPALGQEREETGNRTATPPPLVLPDGQPNVQGDWGPVNGGTLSLTNPISQRASFEGRDLRAPGRIVDPPDGQVPYQPWAAARQQQQGVDYARPTRPEHIDTQHRCVVSGVPRIYYLPSTFKILQPPGSVVFAWEEFHAYRVIPLDDRPPVAPEVKLWMGDGRGHWEGNTLVVDTTNLKGTRLTFVGDFYSDNARVVERFTFVDADNLIYEATIDDPTVFSRPWTIRVAEQRQPDEELWEYACPEGAMGADEFLIQSPSEP